jgi:hypothetical protein
MASHMTFMGVHPGTNGVYIATFVLADGLHRFISFRESDFLTFHALARADAPGTLAAYLLKGPGIDAYRQRYGV